MAKRFKINEEGVCPVCGDEDNLEYDSSEIDEGIKYPWECSACGATGDECYDMTFSGHCNVTDKDGGEYSHDEDYTYEVMDADDKVLDSNYVALDAAIEYAKANGGAVINKQFWSLDDEGNKVDIIAAEVAGDNKINARLEQAIEQIDRALAESEEYDPDEFSAEQIEAYRNGLNKAKLLVQDFIEY